MVTLLIATRNGAKTLPELFEALCCLDVPPGGWKIVLADNGSTDGTKAIAQRYQARLPIVYVFESSPGQNRARNAALAHVEGDLVAFTDDDTTPEPSWLRVLSETARAQPEFSIFGGPVLPRWEREPPDWILEQVDLGACFAVSDREEPDAACDPGHVWSPNMMIRREVFDRGYRFDEFIGPSGESYAMGSETEFLTRLGREGHRARFCRDARVRHYVRAWQLDREWILKRAVRFGRGQYRIHHEDRSYDGPRLFGIPRYRLRLAAAQWLRLTVARLVDRRRAFKEHWEFNYQVGQLVEARARHRHAEPPLSKPR